MVAAVALIVMAILVNTGVLNEYRWLRVLFGISALNFTLRATVPLVLGALSGILCERSGIINIGIEGMMLAGAFAAFVAKVATNEWPLAASLLFAVLIALLTGALMGWLHALLSIRFRMDQIISGTVLIILATGFSSYLFNRDAVAIGKFSAVRIPLLSQIPVVGEVLFFNPPITYLALILVVVVHVALFYTRWGLRTRAVGEHPRAADTVGINVNRYRYVNTSIGGMLAGLAGAFLVLEAVGQFQEGMTAGRGFISLAAMIFGNWNPFGALSASLLFGYTQALQNELLLAGINSFTLPGIGVINVPRQFISMIPYVVTIVAVSGLVGRVRPPAAEGKVYETEGH
ncbi:MAG: ABC transporter permease [Caldilineaceae bacterium]|nr:ABC transporter permease [Caldilineaceae bacterium]MCB0126326.1 ABC transporter permease [Caldilineaceae bacterium]